MKLVYVIFVIFLFTVSVRPCHGLFEWLFGEKGEVMTGKNGEKTPYDENDVKYEVVATDEKFLEFAKTLSDINPLDACYNLVVYTLKKKCGDLNEEELGKLSVQLFNCQAEAENRPVFPCTSSMTLAECTKSMDAITWNGYQIVGNRARAMCYSSQQLTFRRLTEKAVNNLASSAFNHLESMKELKNGQEQIHHLATDTVRKLFESQQDLLTTHESLKNAHQDVFAHVADNVKQLVHEKSLIATGNKQLADMTENIREKLDQTSEYLKTQEKIQKQNHEKILQDLNEIQKKSQAALKDLSAGTKQLIFSHEDMMSQYNVMFKNLQKMNSTITSLLETVTKMQQMLEKRIGWVSTLLGGADDKLGIIMCCIYHIAYFLLVVVLVAFLQVPFTLRTLLMMLIAVDAGIEINYNITLGYMMLSVIVMSTVIAHWTMKWMKWRKETKGFLPNITYTLRDQPLSPTELRELSTILGRLSHNINSGLNISTTDENCNGSATTLIPPRHYVPTPSPVRLHTSSLNSSSSPTSSHHISSSPTSSPHISSSSHHHRSIDPIPEDGGYTSNLSNVRRLLVNQMGDGPRRSDSRSSTPLTSRHSSRSTTPTPGSRCQGTTRAGSTCRMPASSGTDYCYRHR